jgi:Fic family protein
MERANRKFSNKLFGRKDYMKLFKNISSATASRDLKDGASQGRLKKIGERNQTKYTFT